MALVQVDDSAFLAALPVAEGTDRRGGRSERMNDAGEPIEILLVEDPAD